MIYPHIFSRNRPTKRADFVKRYGDNKAPTLATFLLTCQGTRTNLPYNS
jgi:hypothetical protein